MTLRRAGNREFPWSYAHPNRQGNAIGDGTSIHFPICTFGGCVSCFIDVDVPATLSGNDADFSTNYPELGPTPNVFPLFRYANPIDTSKKLNGKGNALITNLCVLYGSPMTGAAPPGTSGTKSFDLSIKIGTQTIWTHTGPQTYSNAVGRVSASTTYFEHWIGTDFGETEMLIDGFTANENLTAGRFRIWWQLSEV